MAAVRSESAPASPLHGSRARAATCAWILVAIAWIETVFMFVLLAVAYAHGIAPVNRAPQAVMAAAFAASCFPMVAATRREPRTLFLLATFSAAASAFALSSACGLPAPWSAAVAALLGFPMEAFVPACLWCFTLDFPRVLRFTAFDRFAQASTRVLWLLGGVLFVVNAAPANLTFDAGLLVYLGRDHSSRLFWRLFSFALVPAFLAILVRCRRAPMSERRKVARLASSIGIGLAPFLLLSASRSAVPAVDEWFVARTTATSMWVYRVVVASLAMMPILSTVAVLADGPFTWYDAGGQALRRGLARAGSIRRGVDLTLALERLSQARGMREMLDVLVRGLRDGVGAVWVRALLARPDDVFSEKSGRTYPPPSDGCVMALLEVTRLPLDLSPAGPLTELLPRKDRDWVAASGVHLAVPIRRRHGDVAAVAVFGPKADGSLFDRRDHLLILTLTAAAAAAWPAPETAHAGAPRGDHCAEVAFECPSCGVVAESSALPCGCSAEAVAAALPPVIAGKFRVQRRIAAGGMSIVYRARDMALCRDVALKTIAGLQPGAVRRLEDEARAMAALRHPSLAIIHGLELWHRTPVLVVEFFAEGTLARRLSMRQLSASDAVTVALDVARALDYMHERGVLHRDLKPSNIAFDRDGGAKLLDFGLATLTPSVHASLVDEHPARWEEISRHSPAGTPGYLSPESRRGGPPSATDDLWALAVVMVECICGVNPFAANRPFGWPHALPAGTPPALRAFLDRALAPSLLRRFQTAREFENALESVRDACLRVRG